MCSRPAILIDAHVDVDDDNRPILCGQLRAWLHDPPNGLTGGEMRCHVYDLDGWTLAAFAKLVYDLTVTQHHHRV